MDNNTKSEFITKQYKRLKVSQNIALTITGHSVKSCCRSVKSATVKLKLNKAGKAYYHGLFKCGSVWDCPHCSGIISSHRRSEIEEALNSWRLTGGSVKLITYTVRHNRGDDLKSVMVAVGEAYRFAKSGAPYMRIKARYNILGSIVANEINYSDEFGWHFHRHEILFYKSKIDINELEDFIYRRYNSKLIKLGFSSLPGIGVNISLDEGDLSNYLSKWGLENEITTSKETGNSKTPFQLLDDPDDLDTFVEYSRRLHGKKRITWSKGMKSYFNLEDKPDEEIIEDLDLEAEEDHTIKEISNFDWRVILKKDLYLQVLKQAETNRDNFDRWFELMISTDILIL